MILSALCALVLCGCGSSNAEVEAARPNLPESSMNTDKITDTKAQQISDPSQAKQGGAYRIVPANPDDPKFKADPKLAGGG